MSFDLESHLRLLNIDFSPLNSEINEGYLTELQKNQFLERLKFYENHVKIKTFVEIGLNAGHSAETIINNLKNFERFVSFDINTNSYTSHAVQYFQKKLKDQFIFIEGDSNKTVSRFQKDHADVKADLIYIDGCHEYQWAFNDIKNCQKFAHDKTVVWIDDVAPRFVGTVERAVIDCAYLGIIKIINHHTSFDEKYGFRGWIEAMYCF